MLKFVDSHEFACICNLVVAAMLLWITWRQRGIVFGLILWYAQRRSRIINFPDEAAREKFSRNAVRWMFVVFACALIANATYHGLLGAGLLKKKPTPTREELEEKLRLRFDKARREQRKPFEFPAETPDGTSDPN